jgi:hypothetical protein
MVRAAIFFVHCYNTRSRQNIKRRSVINSLFENKIRAMHHPFQVIEYISPAGKPFLLGASGSNLLSINLSDGTIASRWPSNRRLSQPEFSEVKSYDFYVSRKDH